MFNDQNKIADLSSIKSTIHSLNSNGECTISNVLIEDESSGSYKERIHYYSFNRKPIASFALNDVAQGLLEPAPVICGHWRTSWVMQLKRKQGKCKLPRGFKLQASKMTVQYV